MLSRFVVKRVVRNCNRQWRDAVLCKIINDDVDVCRDKIDDFFEGWIADVYKKIYRKFKCR